MNTDTQTGIAVNLSECDGNAYAIIARCAKVLKKAGRAERVDAFVAEARAGNYDHLLQTCMRWFDVT